LWSPPSPGTGSTWLRAPTFADDPRRRPPSPPDPVSTSSAALPPHAAFALAQLAPCWSCRSFVREHKPLRAAINTPSEKDSCAAPRAEGTRTPRPKRTKSQGLAGGTARQDIVAGHGKASPRAAWLPQHPCSSSEDPFLGTLSLRLQRETSTSQLSSSSPPPPGDYRTEAANRHVFKCPPVQSMAFRREPLRTDCPPGTLTLANAGPSA